MRVAESASLVARGDGLVVVDLLFFDVDRSHEMGGWSKDNTTLLDSPSGPKHQRAH
jgi:hypothetical protein